MFTRRRGKAARRATIIRWKAQVAGSSAAVRNKVPNARRDILVALATKLILLWVLYVLFFAPPRRPRQDALSTADAVAGPRTAGASQHE